MDTPIFLKDFLKAQSLDALVITRHANFAWLAGGGRSFIGTGSDFGAAQLLVMPAKMVVIANNIEAARLQAEELPEGCRVISYNWWEDGQPAKLVADLVGSGALGADGPFPGASDVGGTLAPLRWTLTPAEQDAARHFGRLTGEALEEACRALQPGETEFEVAARLSAACLARGLDPVTRLVAADERTRQWRHPLPTHKRIQKYAMVVIGTQARGLVISASRLVHFGTPPDDLTHKANACTKVDAAVIKATVPGATASQLFELLRSTYAEVGYPDEWQFHHQGGLAGYAAREWRATPTSPHQVAEGQIYAWNPTIQGVKSEDTVMTTATGPEIITATGNWPTIDVDGIKRPGILIR